MKNFAYIITQKRKELGLTQDALAARLGITPQAISKWENGVGLPDVTLFPAIAKTLGVSIDELFGIDHDPDTREIPEFPQKCAELSFIGSVERLACYSDKTLDHVEGKLFYFTDGSVADLARKEVRNCGKGEIRILEADEKNARRGASFANVTLEKPLADFSLIIAEFSIPCDFHMVKSDAFRLEAEGTTPFIESICAENEGDLLKLTVRYPKDQHFHVPHEDNKITLFTNFEKGKKCAIAIGGSSDFIIDPDFEEMKLAIGGSGTFHGKNANILQATVNGSGDITLDTAKTANLFINGSGDISVKAVTESTTARINGSGDIEIGEARNIDLRIAGSGDIVVPKASGSLTAVINGSGDMEVGGEVESLVCTIAGAGDIHAAKLTTETAELTTKGDSMATITIGHIKGISTERLGKNTTLHVKKRG